MDRFQLAEETWVDQETDGQTNEHGTSLDGLCLVGNDICNCMCLCILHFVRYSTSHRHCD
jgi:hypothetical protein